MLLVLRIFSAHSTLLIIQGKQSRPQVMKVNPATMQQSPALTQAGSMGSAVFGRDTNGNFKCPFPGCAKAFSNQTAGKRHFESNHSGIEFTCKMCVKSFKRKDVLKRHAVQVHNLNEAMATAMLT